MHYDTVPVLKDVVLVGAGHAHVQVLKLFGMDPLPGVRITLITREAHTPYSGMLPGLIAGYYTFDDTHIDTGPLCRFAGARLYNDTVVGIDRKAKLVLCSNRPPAPYDVLSIDIGSSPATAGIPGASDHAVPVKPVDGFLGRFDAMLTRVLEAKEPRHIAMIGGGASGIELLLAAQCRVEAEMRAAGRDPASVSFSLVSASHDILPAFPPKMRARFASLLKERGIDVVSGAAVSQVGAGVLHFEQRAPLNVDEVLLCTAGQPASWLRQTGLPLTPEGFIKAGATLQVEGEGDIFAAGDVIAFGPRALPKSGVYSVRAGPVLAGNIKRLLMGRALKAFKPQRRAMYLLSAGAEYAVGTRNGFVFGGKWVWRWKSRIDRRFMSEFNDLPEVAADERAVAVPVVDEETRRELSFATGGCGGCGAKLGTGEFSHALAGLAPVKRVEVMAGLKDAEDAAITDPGGDTQWLQTADHFRAVIDDPYISGKIAAHHVLGGIYAMGGSPQTALALVTLPPGIAAKSEADLRALMAGVNEVLSEANCELTGGRTAQGAELALGFAVTGTVGRNRVLRKGGAQTGDLLILTKPLGAGTLLAADTRGRARARWIMAAVAHMLQSNREAAEILQRYDVHAVTHVAGSGLLGHLAEMLRASKTAAVLRLGALKVLPGVTVTLEEGFFSSMHPQNLRLRRLIRQAEGLTHPLYPVLFDAQTGGGLLAAAPWKAATAILADLNAAGYTRAAVIGEIMASDGAPQLVSLRP